LIRKNIGNEGENMRAKKILSFTKIILCFAFTVIFLSFQSCKRDLATPDQTSSLKIYAEDWAPCWSPDCTRIAFCSYREGQEDIYIMNADGSNPIQLTDNTAEDSFPSWSPEGDRIAFHSNRDGNSNIYVMNIDGSNQTRLTDNAAKDEGPAWSPDGDYIIFSSDRDGNSEIYIMKTDGSDQTRLTDNPGIERRLSWAPDGSKIVFESRRDGNWDIYRMNADGSNQTRLTEEPGHDVHPSWSPDGSRIIFGSDRDGNMEIYTMNSDGSNPIRLTESALYDSFPSWSPDGRKIVFASDRAFDEEVYVMDADGSNPVNLTNNAPVNATFGLAPLPQSELDLDKIPFKIVFQSYRETNGKENWEICLIDADGSGFINLTNTPEIDERYPHASPDGRLICFVADEGDDLESKRRNVYYMNIDGTNRVRIAKNAYQPCWSPDGRYIAYLPAEYPRYNRNHRANKGIEIYDLETGEKKRHPNDKIMHIARLCWSPDGKWFICAAPMVDNWRRKDVFKVDDNTMMNLSLMGCTPDISPDGKRIAWNGSDFSLNIGKLDFNSPQNTVSDHRMVVACEQDHWIYYADWSPDEKYFVFTYGFEDKSKPKGKQEPWSHICICDLKTGKWTQITTDGKYNEEPDWVPMQVR
jgi:Tol biopolymer transport system component